MKICPVGAEPSCSMQTAGETQMDRHDEANSCLSQFCECN